jgi:hypothetical protein
MCLSRGTYRGVMTGAIIICTDLLEYNFKKIMTILKLLLFEDPLDIGRVSGQFSISILNH